MSTDSHWYNSKAEACHTIVGKNGKERKTTLADARKLGLFPSVSGIIGVLAKDTLTDWKHRQITEAAFMTQPKAGEPPEAYHSRIMEAAFKQVGEAADLGTRIHKAIEHHFQGEPYDQALKVYVDAVDRWKSEHDMDFLSQELRLINIKEGYAGTTDVGFSCSRGSGILDFKSRKTKPDKPVTPWETQPMQIAAYLEAMDGMKTGGIGCNLYISTTEPGRVDACWYTNKELQAEWRAFLCCRDLWIHAKGFDPRINAQMETLLSAQAATQSLAYSPAERSRF